MKTVQIISGFTILLTFGFTSTLCAQTVQAQNETASQTTTSCTARVTAAVLFAALDKAPVNLDQDLKALETRIIRGVVTDAESGEPLTGVAVWFYYKFKEGDKTRSHCITDLNGRYSIVFPKDCKEFFVGSYTGYFNQTIVPDQSDVVDVALQAAYKKLAEKSKKRFR